MNNIICYFFLINILLSFNPHDDTESEGYLMSLSWGGSTCKFNKCTHYG